jgi:aryl-alcohol dehydrogenase-like predicted oxidoreductase
VPEAALAPLRETMRVFVADGGKVIDTASTYGEAQALVGRFAAELNLHDRLCLATKVDAEGRAEGERQLQQAFVQLRTARIDLVAVHNLVDTVTQLPLLREAKAAGKLRYVGVTTSFERQHPGLERLIRAERLDFAQVDFALDNRDAARRIFPAAQEHGTAIMVNLPFGRHRLFNRVRATVLPDWAAEFDCHSWPQFFLKYILSYDAVTCVIPGMAKPEYPPDNLGAAHGRLPDAAMRQRMERFVDAL